MKGSYLSKMVGSKKGLIAFPMSRTIGDIVIIKHVTAPVRREPKKAREEAA